MIIIFTILHVIAKTSISMNSPASIFIKIGVTKGANKVATEVIVNDNARFALAKYAITLDAMPLGEQPISTIPAAISAGRSLINANPKPDNGIMIYCAVTPIKTLLGVLNTDTKSFALIEVPMPNIII